MSTSTKFRRQEISKKNKEKNTKKSKNICKKISKNRNYKNDSETNENIIHLNVYKNCGKICLNYIKYKIIQKRNNIIHTYAAERTAGQADKGADVAVVVLIAYIKNQL